MRKQTTLTSSSRTNTKKKSHPTKDFIQKKVAALAGL